MSCQAALKPWLDSYSTAKTLEQRHLQGLFLLMRFPSAEPLVHTGNQRSAGFAGYNDLRDNWWCGSIVYRNTNDSPGNYRQVIQDVLPNTPGFKPSLFNQPIVPVSQLPSSPFVTPTDAQAADDEIARLRHLHSAPDYFATEALAWEKAHPSDPHNADLLGFAKRVIRNGCRTSDSTELDHQLFLILHRKYPNSEWAKRYTTWE